VYHSQKLEKVAEHRGKSLS